VFIQCGRHSTAITIVHPVHLFDEYKQRQAAAEANRLRGRQSAFRLLLCCL